MALGIDARKGWQRTHVTMKPNQNVKITVVNGTWSANPIAHVPTDYGGAGCTNYKEAGSSYPLPKAPEGALLAKVVSATIPDEKHAVHLIGAGGTINTNYEGEVYLVINDDLGGLEGEGLQDNRGTLFVEVSQAIDLY